MNEHKQAKASGRIVHTSSVEDMAYERIGLAVVRQACDDYAVAFQDYILSPLETREELYKYGAIYPKGGRLCLKEIDRFFNSVYFNLYMPNTAPECVVKRAKLNGVQMAYQKYIYDMAKLVRGELEEPTGRMKRFKEYVLSDEFKKICKNVAPYDAERILKDGEIYAHCYNSNIRTVKERNKTDIGNNTAFLKLDGKLFSNAENNRHNCIPKWKRKKKRTKGKANEH